MAKLTLINDDGTLESHEVISLKLTNPNTELLDITDLDPIVRSNIIELVKRSYLGVAKYGTTLHENNTDDFLQHAKEEAMDFINYLEKLRQRD